MHREYRAHDAHACCWESNTALGMFPEPGLIHGSHGGRSRM